MSIKISGFTLFLLLNICVVASAESAPSQGFGRVNMAGAIIEAACAIGMLSRDQTINMGTVPINQISRNGEGLTYPFTIQLVNCVLARHDKNLPDWRHFQITFDGSADADLFGVAGDAKGVALKIADSQGNIATPGVPLPRGEITPKEMQLNYSLQLVSNKQNLYAGEYSSTVKFKMDYY
ncbi:fimbrial protein [Pseudomonas graminis]